MSTDWFTRAVQFATNYKENIVATRGIGSDVQPVLALHSEDRLIAQLVLPEDRNALLSLVPTAIALSDAVSVVHVGEGYWWIGADAIDYLMHEEFGSHGDMAKRFAAGDEKIVEAVTVTCVTADKARSFTGPYTYDGRKIVWDEPVYFDDTHESRHFTGATYLAMREGFAMQAARTEPALFPEELARRVGLSMVDLHTEQGPRPPRNAPCPCGSGRKSKVCCFR